MVDALCSFLHYFLRIVHTRSHIFSGRFIYTASRGALGPRATECRLSSRELREGCRLGIDSHADTTCVGKHGKILEVIEGQVVEAIPFAKSIGSIKNLPIVNAAVAYDHPTNGQTFILVLNQSIYLGADNENCLLCPNQCRANGIVIDDRPTEYAPDSHFSIDCPDHDVSFPLLRFGPTAYIRVHRPSEEELLECEHIDLTDDTPWDPYQDLDGPGDGSLSLFQIESMLKSNTMDQVFHDNISHSEHPLDSHILLSSLGEQIESHVTRSIFGMTVKYNKEATPERLAKLWGCGLATAKRTLDATTHTAYREFSHTTGSIGRKFRTRRSQLRYRQLSMPHGRFYTDTMFAKIKSIRGFTCAQIYCNNMWFVHAYPMRSKSEVPQTLTLLHQDVGVPPHLHSDNAPELVKGEFARINRRQGTKQTSIETNKHNQNRAELCIREVKKKAWRVMVRDRVPVRLWCFALEYVSQLMCLLASPLTKLKGRTSYEHIFGFTPDISEYIEFPFYGWVWYWDDSYNFPEGRRHLGRWLGVAHKVGQGLTYYILTNNATVVSRSTVANLSDVETSAASTAEAMAAFTKTVESKIGDFRKALVDPKENLIDFDESEVYSYCMGLNPGEDHGVHEPADSHLIPPDEQPREPPSEDREEFDNWIGSQVSLPSKNGESMVLARVTNRKRDSNGNLVGSSNPNPILDTRVYTVEFPDGYSAEYSANVIAENLYSQVDDDGHNLSYLKDIVGHRKLKDAIPMEDGYITLSNGQRKPIVSTKGWEFNVLWADQSTSWVTLRDLKESNPVELADYAMAHLIQHEPAFRWWVPHTIRKRDRIISKVRTRFKQRNIKFGVEVPRTVEAAFELDKKNGNNHWRKAIEKEMNKVEVAFQFCEDGESPPPGYKRITCHLVFDVKFDLTRKARYVAGGHLTDAPTSMTYSSVVSRDSVRILLTAAALNDLDLLACDISNAYLHAATKEKLYFIAGDEWGSKKGRKVVIVRALYGLKSSGKQWQRHFADTLRHDLKYTPSKADDNVWMKRCTRDDGSQYYAYILCYVDDVICIHHDPSVDMKFLRSKYPMKQDPEVPKMYLGADIGKYTYDITQSPCWTMGSDSYVKEAVKVVKARMASDDVKFVTPSKTPSSPFHSTSYRAELDVSSECNEDQAQFYQNLIGILRWIVELGRVDILTETSILSRYLACPRVGHLHQALHIFHYLDHHSRSKIAFNPTSITWKEEACLPHETPTAKAEEMRELYPDAIDEIPPNAPTPLGREMQINMFVDADHAGDRVTRRSHTGIIIFLGKSPVVWYSKRQNCVESSSFGSEFVAMRIATELLKSLCYKLRMFGIPLEGPANVFCDHKSVVINSSTPASTLKKKHHSVAYHVVREAIACKIALIRHVLSEQNIADLFTKVLPAHKRQFFTSKITV